MSPGKASRPGEPAVAQAPTALDSVALNSVAVDLVAVRHARERVPSAEQISRLTSVLSLMSDPVRLRVLYALDVSEELCVGDLALALDLNEDQISYALRLLRTAGLVHARKRGRVVLNRLATDFPEPLREHCLHRLVELTREAGRQESQGSSAAVGH